MKSNLVIVAHPDDETIWMGGTMLERADEQWTVISLCRKSDPDRMPKFMKVCASYPAKGIIADLDDELLQPLNQEYLQTFIRALIPQGSFDTIYTHGANGEYGHLRHIETHTAVKKLFLNGTLNAKKLVFFNYTPSTIPSSHDSELMIPIAHERTGYYVTLSADKLKKKIFLVERVYGFASTSFEVVSCGVKEGFIDL